MKGKNPLDTQRKIPIKMKKGFSLEGKKEDKKVKMRLHCSIASKLRFLFLSPTILSLSSSNVL